jgi:hypothetical protein
MRMIKLASAVVAVAIVVAGCGGQSAGAGSPGATGPAATSSSTVAAHPAAGGSCQVTVTGDITASWKATQDNSSLLVSYWLSSSSRTMMALSGEALILNCKGAAGSVSFTTPDKTSTSDFPKAPKNYVVPMGGVIDTAQPGEIGMLLNLNDKQVWKVVEPGSFNVTTFGNGKFVGTFLVKIGRVGDDLTTITGNAVVSGSFDFGCTGDACN